MKKIVIVADSVAEAKADLEMIEKAMSMGATSGEGSSEMGEMSVKMPRVKGVMAERMTEAYACACGCCCKAEDEPRRMSLEDAMAMVYYGYLD